MTPLGLAPGHCREAVDRYRERVAELALSLEPVLAGDDRPAGSRLLLDDFADRVEVDALSRTGPGAARMTRVEATVFAPLVSQLREHIQELSQFPPGPAWPPVLAAMEEQLAAAHLTLADWEARTG